MGKSGYFATADVDACCVLTEYKVLEKGNMVLIAALHRMEIQLSNLQMTEGYRWLKVFFLWKWCLNCFLMFI